MEIKIDAALEAQKISRLTAEARQHTESTAKGIAEIKAILVDVVDRLEALEKKKNKKVDE
jgi:hypothetical protein